MHKVSLTALAGVAHWVLAGTANAAIIDFDGLSGVNGTVFTGPYIEDGFSISTLSGTIAEAQAYGSPTPSLLFGRLVGTTTAALQLTRSGGGLFTLGGFDLSGNLGVTTFLAEGFVGASSIFTLSGSQGTTAFQTFAGAAPNIDKVVFSFDVGGSSANIDNINVNAQPAPGVVPEPATWALMLAGFGAVGAAMRRRQGRAVRSAIA